METSSIEGIYRTSQTFVRRVNTDIHRYLYDQIRKNKDFEQIKDLPDSTVATGGNVSSDGGFVVTARGVCYGPLPYPDLTNTYSHTTNGSGTGYFASQFSLPGGSGLYYIRAYATNANGTSYGEQVTVIQPYDTLPTFQYNGHTYRVAPEPNNQYLHWSTANTYCENLTLYGYTDWRMPTKDELMQMYSDRNSIGDFVTNYNYGADYWSGTTCNGNQYNGHYYVSFSSGLFYCSEDVSRNCRVRPIRIDQ